jgi:hypothetical protein
MEATGGKKTNGIHGQDFIHHKLLVFGRDLESPPSTSCHFLKSQPRLVK